MNKTKDMTVGSPTKTIFFFSVPVLLGTLFQQIYNMADTIIVGQFLGEDALAAVGATGSTVYLVIGFASGLTQGCGILVSQAFGGHRLNELKKVVGTALLLTVVFSVILTIPTVSFSRQILLALHTPSNVLLYAHEYLRVIFGGILCTMAYNIAASILRSLGDSRTPLYFLILSSFLNIVLDIFFIATLHMGTAGAAWATVLSQGISALLCFWYMFHNYNNLRLSIRDLYPDPYRILCMIQSGIPMALNQTVTAFGIMMRYTQYRGLAQVTNWVKLKFVAINLKKLAVWKWSARHPGRMAVCGPKHPKMHPFSAAFSAFPFVCKENLLWPPVICSLYERQ